MQSVWAPWVHGIQLNVSETMHPFFFWLALNCRHLLNTPKFLLLQCTGSVCLPELSSRSHKNH